MFQQQKELKEILKLCEFHDFFITVMIFSFTVVTDCQPTIIERQFNLMHADILDS